MRLEPWSIASAALIEYSAGLQTCQHLRTSRAEIARETGEKDINLSLSCTMSLQSLCAAAQGFFMRWLHAPCYNEQGPVSHRALRCNRNFRFGLVVPRQDYCLIAAALSFEKRL